MGTDYLVGVVLVLAATPAFMTVWNHFVFRRPPEPGQGDAPRVSILIPARDESGNIEAAVRACLASEGVEMEVVVLDDHSTDDTVAIVERLVREDGRVRLERAPALPAGWCGKQHACARLAEHARHELLFFLDADVRIAPAAVARMVAFLEEGRTDLVSAFPHQVTGTVLEKLMIPLIEFMLLGYLPLWFSRIFRSPGFGAGCGQVFLARRAAYSAVGGHGAIHDSLHDGLKLPRAFREAGYRTDLCVGEGLFECRMYRSGPEVWAGLQKNAHEGIASPGLIGPFSILLFGGAVLPVVLAACHPLGVLGEVEFPMVLAGLGLCYLPRILNAVRFRQSWLGVVFHPLSVGLFLILQWRVFFRRLAGHKPQWRGRSVG